MKFTLTAYSINCQPKPSFRSYFLLAGGIVCIIIVLLVIFPKLPGGDYFIKRAFKHICNLFTESWADKMVFSNEVRNEAVYYKKRDFCLTLHSKGSLDNWDTLEVMTNPNVVPLQIYSANRSIYYIGEDSVDVIDTKEGKVERIFLGTEKLEAKLEEVRNSSQLSIGGVLGHTDSIIALGILCELEGIADSRINLEAASESAEHAHPNELCWAG